MTLAELRDAAPADFDAPEESPVNPQVTYRELEVDLVVQRREDAADVDVPSQGNVPHGVCVRSYPVYE